MRYLRRAGVGPKYSDTNTTLQTHAPYVHGVCIYLGLICATGLCSGKRGLSVSRCLLKQGEPKHKQTQVMKPGPLISITALVPSAQEEVP